MSDGTKLLSVQLHAHRDHVWKFNLGRLFKQTGYVKNYGDLEKLLHDNTRFIQVQTDIDTRRKCFTFMSC